MTGCVREGRHESGRTGSGCCHLSVTELLDLAQLMLIKNSCQHRSTFRAEMLLSRSLLRADYSGNKEQGVAAALGWLHSAGRARNCHRQQNREAGADSW